MNRDLPYIQKFSFKNNLCLLEASHQMKQKWPLHKGMYTYERDRDRKGCEIGLERDRDRKGCEIGLDRYMNRYNNQD